MDEQSTFWERLKQRPWHITGLILVVALLSAGVAPLASASPVPQESEILQIGYLGTPDSDTANGAQLAIDQINDAGGVTAPDGTNYVLQLMPFEGGFLSVETLPDAIDSLVADGADVLLGPNAFSLLTEEGVDALTGTGLPVLTAGTYNQLTENDTEDVIFRIRAPEYVYSYALATYMIEDLELESIALVQTDTQYTEPLLNFNTVLESNDLNAAERIQMPDSSGLPGAITQLAAIEPEAVVLWGSYNDAAELLEGLKDNGWNGVFAYRYAEQAVRAGVLDDELKQNVLGVTSWAYSYTGRTSQIFLRDYVVAFGSVPGPLSAAAYDAVWYLWSVIRDFGATTDDLLEGFRNGSPRTLVQGVMHPVDYENGDLIRVAVVYELGEQGGPTVVARFDDTQRLPIEDEDILLPEPTATLGPPTSTPFPTATLVGTYARVTANVLNVRSGPGFNYDRVGQVQEGDLLEVLGANADYSWLTVNFQSGVGWVKSEYVTIEGSLGTVPQITPPATPFPSLTPAPTVSPDPDIVIQGVTLSPSQPIPNRPFSATVTVANVGGGAAGRFGIAATFLPNDVYTSAIIEGLAAGQTIQTQLSGTLTGTGVFSIEVVGDLNKEIAEANEANNNYNLTYRVDYPLYTQQSNNQLGPGTNWDLYGGTTDFTWDGFNIAMQNGAQIGIIGGTYEDAHYDLLSPGVVNNAVGVGTDQVTPGTVFGVYTAEGERAVMRIDNRQGEQIWITYRVYNDTP